MTVSDSGGRRMMGPWLLSDILGGGISAQVFAGAHRFSGKEAAVKVLRQDRSRRLEDGVRFLREGRLLSKLDHPSIPELLDMGVGDRSRMFLAIQRFPGRDIRTILQGLGGRTVEIRRQVRDDLLLPAWTHVAAALQHAHQRGIGHGDVTPSNILVDGRGGAAGLVDWGLARRFDPPAEPDPPLDGPKGVLRVHGTPGYVAPETLGAERVQPCPATDIYSLGAVLFHILAFQPAIQASTVPGRLAAAWQPVQDPRELAPDMHVPDHLAVLAMRAMSVDPAHRPASAAEFRAEAETA
ncbi:MAG: serine/threonine protein kinase [Deltaproteobacteria bacterium]|nr:serine/threonine protein kinase [Deltaproteobacteria bacterium]